MPLVDYARIIGRAAFVRHKCGFFDAKPPYSTKKVFDTCFPDIHVTGSNTMPKGVTELAIRNGKTRTLFYNRQVCHNPVHGGITHGCAPFLTDLLDESALSQ